MSAPWIGGGTIAGHTMAQALARVVLHGPAEVAATRAMRRCERTWRMAADTLGPASGAAAVWRLLVRPVAEALDWEPGSEAVDTMTGVSVRISRGTLGAGHQLLIATPWGISLDGLQRAATRLAAREGHAWVALCNGIEWRWYDATRPYTRDHVALDLSQAMVDGRVWQSLWLCGQATAGRTSAADPHTWLDRLATASSQAGAGAARTLRADVAAVMEGLAAHARGSHDTHVGLVFQWLFLLFAEARLLVPAWHPAWSRSYGLTTLGRDASRPWQAVGLHDSLVAIAGMGSRGGRLASLRVPALNGELLAWRLEGRGGRALPDSVVAPLIARLSQAEPGRAHAPSGPGGVPVDLATLDVEHLGAIYEHLMAPQSSSEPALLRKRTGAFYTPRSMADQLVARTLDPLVAEARADDILALRILDPAMGSGALLASALRYLVRAVECAWVREGRGGPLDVPREEREALPRRIAEQCLFGVDVNARAVQVARLSLWLLSLAPDRPLTWLDAHLRVGDSLVGVSPGVLLARPPVRRPGTRTTRAEGQLTLFDLEHWHHEAAAVGPQLRALAARPSSSAEEVHDKARRWAALRSRGALARWRRRADAWCGAAMDATPSTGAAWRAVDETIRNGIDTGPVATARARDRWLAAAAARGCLHWAIEFPDVFDDGRGGFDVVLANPPWEMLRGDLGSGDDRAAHRDAVAPLQRFVQRSGLYREATGHLNTYQLFVERMLHLLRPGGRIGCLLPGSVLADQGAAGLRRHLFDHAAIDHLSVVDNREGLFPIHRSVRIVSVTATAGAPTEALVVDMPAPRATPRPDRRPHARHPAPRQGGDAHLLTRDLLRAASGHAEAIPHLRTHADLALLARLVRWPRLGDPPWNLRFGRELNATDDRHVLARDGRGDVVVVDGKHLRAFAVRPPPDAARATDAALATALTDTAWQRWRLAYRDVSSPTNTRSLIAALLPPGHVSTHTVTCLRARLPLPEQLYLCGMLNSLVADWFVRRYLGAHVTSKLIARLPVPRPGPADPDRRAMARLAARLARDPADQGAEGALQALAVRIYALSPEEVEAVVADFPRVSSAVADGMRDAAGGEARPC